MKNIKLTTTQQIILKGFKKLFKKNKECPTNFELEIECGIHNETCRKIMLFLSKNKFIKINKKLKSRKFYL